MASLAEIQKILEQIRDDLPALINRSQISPHQVVVVSGLSDVSERLGLIQAGEFRTGNGVEPGLGFSGVRIGYPAFSYNSELWNIVGINNDVLQVGIRSSDGKLLAAAGDVVIDSTGIKIQTSTNIDTAQLSFEHPDDYYGYMRFLSFGGLLYIINTAPGSQIRFLTDLTNPAQDGMITMGEDGGQDNRQQFNVGLGTMGGRISIDNGILMDAKGTSGGSNRLLMRGYANNTPDDPSDAFDEVNIYQKGNNLVLQFNDGGTVRYKYLDLTGTGVTWVHSTTAP